MAFVSPLLINKKPTWEEYTSSLDFADPAMVEVIMAIRSYFNWLYQQETYSDKAKNLYIDFLNYILEKEEAERILNSKEQFFLRITSLTTFTDFFAFNEKFPLIERAKEFWNGGTNLNARGRIAIVLEDFAKWSEKRGRNNFNLGMLNNIEDVKTEWG